MTVTTERLSEQRVLSLAVTGAPDYSVAPGLAVLIPDILEVTYRWIAQGQGGGSYQPVSSIEVHGVRRLKSGQPGTARATIRVYPNDEQPQWMTYAINAHMPEGWAA